MCGISKRRAASANATKPPCPPEVIVDQRPKMQGQSIPANRLPFNEEINVAVSRAKAQYKKHNDPNDQHSALQEEI
jgi:hypothetical protein